MKIKLTLLGLILSMLSCKTYTVTPENFKKQFSDTLVNKLSTVKTNNPFSLNGELEFQANSLKKLNVIDKSGNAFEMVNSPSIEMRVTLKNGKRKVFYFDTVTIENDTLKGQISRILGWKDKVPFDQIIKIEVQDGGKNYYYEDKTTKVEKISENVVKILDGVGEVKEKFNLTVDSISIYGVKYNSMYYANCKFEKSNSILDILYFIDNGSLQKASIRETSPNENEIYWTNELYIENDQIFYQESHGFKKDTTENASEKKKYKYKSHKFNRNLNKQFLNKFSLELYRKIKNSR